jgi:hypothetical protein
VLALATALRFWFISMLGESVVADLRRRLYAHLLTLDTAFFERSRSGELLSRITADAELVQTVIGSSVSVALRSVVMLVGASALLVITSPKLAGLAALVIPLAILPIVFFGRRVRGLSKESQERIADAQRPGGGIARRHPDPAGLHPRDGGSAALRRHHPALAGHCTTPHRHPRLADADGHPAGLRGDHAGVVDRRQGRAGRRP